MIYRGVKYEAHEAHVEMAESKTVGHYRGATFNLRTPKQVPAQRHEPGMKYRGVEVK